MARGCAGIATAPSKVEPVRSFEAVCGGCNLIWLRDTMDATGTCTDCGGGSGATVLSVPTPAAMAVFEAEAYAVQLRKIEIELLWEAALAADVLEFPTPAGDVAAAA